MIYTNIDFENHSHLSTKSNIEQTINLNMLGEEISTEGPIHIYFSEQFNPFDLHCKVQLEFTIE